MDSLAGSRGGYTGDEPLGERRVQVGLVKAGFAQIETLWKHLGFWGRCGFISKVWVMDFLML